MTETEQLPEFDPDLDQPEPEPELEEDHQEPELDEPIAAVGPPQFAYNDRLLAFGYSGSGKSEVLNVIFSGVECQKLLIDTKPEFFIDDVDVARTPGEIDWAQPIIHYQPLPGSDCSQFEEIFGAAFTRRGLVICAHELGALVDYNASRAGRYLISYLSQGARLGLGALVGAQRLVYIPVAAQTEANHALVFTPQLARREDNDAAAQTLSPVNGAPLSTNEMIAELSALHHEHGDHSFLWKARRTGQLIAFPPLPDDVRSLSIVHRLEDA